LGSKEDLDFTSELSSKIDNIHEVSLDLCDNKMRYKVKYEELYIFSISEGNRYDEKGNRYDEGNGYNKGNRYNEDNRYKDNHKQTSIIKKQYIITKSISKIITNQHSKYPKAQEIYTNIISNCLILSAIANNSNIDKIEIYSEKHKAVLKNKEGKDIIVGPVNLLGFLIEYEVFENKVLKENRLKVAKLYHKFLLLEADLLVVASFFNSNSCVPKSTYYKEIAEILEIIIIQNSKQNFAIHQLK
ncbi:2837_t:CDS:2, partial [Dentiscutata heterogama]